LFLDIVQYLMWRWEWGEFSEWYCTIFDVEEARVRQWVSPYLHLDVFFVWLFGLESIHHNMKSCAL